MPITIDTDSLANLLRGLRGATIVGLAARTIPEMRKTGNPYFGRVAKLCRLTAVIGGSYESGVNRRRVKEAAAAGRPSVDHFQAGPRAWGQHAARCGCGSSRRTAPSPLILYQCQRYLHLQRQQVLTLEYRDMQSGDEIAASEIEPWLRRTHEGQRQGLRRPVICRDYKLESILQLRMRGKIYRVVPPRKRRAA